MLKRPQSNPSHKGQQKERLAEQYLIQQGLRPLTRNFRCKMGEIDLVMRDADTTVFVEVRYRKNSAFGSALESVDFRKRSRLIRAAEFYLLRQSGANDYPSRFDVVAISGDDKIDWVENAFDC